MQKVHQIPDPGELAEKKLGKAPLIHPRATVLDSCLGEYTEVDAHSFLDGVTMGDYSYVHTHVRALWCDIGKFTSIASHCVINPGDHPYVRVTQHHCTYRARQYGFSDRDDEDFFEWRRDQKTSVGHDVWLGHGVYLMPGARVGHGAVVGAGSVVVRAHPVAPYEIAVGVPARPVKKRFADQIRDQFLAIRYWDWPREKLVQAFEDFKTVEAFLEKYGV